MTEALSAAARHEAPIAAEAPAPESTAIVPATTVAGRSLVLVIAIMGYLACLTIGGVALVARAASAWEGAISSEVSIQLRPVPGTDLEAAAERAAAAALATPGVSHARVIPPDESARLLEPWLGAGLDLKELPVPRIVAVALKRGAPADLDSLRQALASIPGAGLDDHRLWQARLKAMAQTMILLGLGILALVLTATVLTVVFATRGAMASNRDIVSVLDFVGASQSFIAREFQHHFLLLGLKGGAAGGVAALVTFLLAGWALGAARRTPSAEQLQALVGHFGVGPAGYTGIAGVVALIAALTALTTRLAVMRYLERE
jgi:cell division transport system permease protein